MNQKLTPCRAQRNVVGVAYRSVTDLPPFTLCVAWPQDSRAPAVAAFVRAATEVAGSPVATDAPAQSGG